MNYVLLLPTRDIMLFFAISQQPIPLPVQSFVLLHGQSTLDKPFLWMHFANIATIVITRQMLSTSACCFVMHKCFRVRFVKALHHILIFFPLVSLYSFAPCNILHHITAYRDTGLSLSLSQCCVFALLC